MIHYSLKCDHDHRFDSWFKSAAAFEALSKAGHVVCAVCGSDKVEKAVMAPRVARSDGGEAPALKEAPPVPMLKTPGSDVERAIADLRRKVEASSDYVGTDFARQARAMHDGDLPERSIFGEARPDQARALIDDGVPLVPLPFRPTRKTQ
jgi:hypothetical protein